MLRVLKSIGILLLVFCALICPSISFASNTSSEPELSEAKAYALLDSQGTILYSHNAYEELAFASITKVMTAMIVLDSVQQLDTIVVAPAVQLPPDAQAAGIHAEDRISIKDLLEVLLVYSANDAAEVLAHITFGSPAEFIDAMNTKAKRIGMHHTVFKNPSGLDESGHVSSAFDLSLMGKYALENYPLIAKIVKQESVDISINGVSRPYFTTNKLLGVDASIQGIKTGKIDQGTSFLSSALRNNVTLFSCVLLCKTDEGRFLDTEKLLDWGFSQYRDVVLCTPGKPLLYRPCLYNFQLFYPVYAVDTLAVPILKGSKASISKSIELNDMQYIQNDFGGMLFAYVNQKLFGTTLLKYGIPTTNPSIQNFLNSQSYLVLLSSSKESYVAFKTRT